MSQLVMRSFDVADKGEVKEGEDPPPGRKDTRPPPPALQQRRVKGREGERKRVGVGRKQLHSNDTGHEGLNTAECRDLPSHTQMNKGHDSPVRIVNLERLNL